MLNQPRILVATDFSEGSHYALEAAESIRALSRGTLYLVHVTSLPNERDWRGHETALSYLPTTYREDLLRDLNKRITQELADSNAQGKTEILFGNPAKTIHDYAKNISADIIITGHKGPGLTLDLLGSVATKLASSSEIPLLIVKGPFQLDKVAGLIEATRPLEEIFDATEEFGFLFNAQIEFLSFQQDIGAIAQSNLLPKTKGFTRFEPEEIDAVKRAMEVCIRRFMEPESKATIRTEVSEERTPYALRRMLEVNSVDLAVISRNQRNFLERIFIGSVTRRLLEIYSGNILVLPPADQDP